MKTKIIATLIVTILSIQAYAATQRPVCSAIGSRSEGWYRDGQLIKTYLGGSAWQMCETKGIECSAIGSRSEGWYTFEKSNRKFIQTVQSCNDLNNIPQCGAIGTRSEGWYFPQNGGMRWDNCANKVIECQTIYDNITGEALYSALYAFEKSNKQLLTYELCH